MANGYKEPGKKMTSKNGMSKNEERLAVKAGVIPSAAEAAAYGRDSDMSRREWQQRQRWSLRVCRVHYKRQPMYDMDGGIYHENY